MYLDSAYIAKYYVNEPDSAAIRKLVIAGPVLYSSLWALAEVQCVFHRKMREGGTATQSARDLARIFLGHVEDGFWTLVPVRESLLKRAGAVLLSSPPNIFLRAGDAVHLTTAKELCEREIWTNDRHMLAAAPQFGLIGPKRVIRP